MKYPGESTHFSFPADLALPAMDTASLKPGLTGIVPARNAIRLDYCHVLAVKSLLPVCDEVIFSDSDSDDGTREAIEAIGDPKIRIINYPWMDPVGDLWFLPRWMNFIRLHARFLSQISLDADEVLHPKAYPRVRRMAEQFKSSYFHRLNFWGDAHHLAPHNTVCAQYVVRQTQAIWETPCDGFYNPEPPAKIHALKPTDDLLIYHLGFLRKNDAFFAKSKVVQRALVNTYDPNLRRAEEEGKPWHAYSPFKEPLIPFVGDYPPGVVEWLNERNY